MNTENLELARIALSRLGLIGRSNERGRRPNDDEISDLLRYFDNKTNMIIPMGRVIRFAIATAMRLEEIFKINWSDVDLDKKLEQRILTGGKGRVFPYHHKSAGTAFQRGRYAPGIDDLHFHDLRHEATSRLFEAGLTSERAALVTGRKETAEPIANLSFAPSIQIRCLLDVP